VPEVVLQHNFEDEQTHGMEQGIMTTEFLHMLNPKNFKFLPPQFTQAIRSAGAASAKEKPDTAYELIQQKLSLKASQEQRMRR